MITSDTLQLDCELKNIEQSTIPLRQRGGLESLSRTMKGTMPAGKLCLTGVVHR